MTKGTEGRPPVKAISREECRGLEEERRAIEEAAKARQLDGFIVQTNKLLKAGTYSFSIDDKDESIVPDAIKVYEAAGWKVVSGKKRTGHYGSRDDKMELVFS